MVTEKEIELINQIVCEAVLYSDDSIGPYLFDGSLLRKALNNWLAYRSAQDDYKVAAVKKFKTVKFGDHCTMDVKVPLIVKKKG